MLPKTPSMENPMHRFVLFIATLLFVCVGCESRPSALEFQSPRLAPTLENALQLEEIARLAGSGQLGCGSGTYQYTAHNGQKREVDSGLDPIHVFGGQISGKTMAMFIDARVEANKTGNGPMSGDMESLLVVTLHIIAESEDPIFINSIAPLLADPLPWVHHNAASSLITIANRHPKFREQIKSIFSEYTYDPKTLESTLPQWLE